MKKSQDRLTTTQQSLLFELFCFVRWPRILYFGRSWTADRIIDYWALFAAGRTFRYMHITTAPPPPLSPNNIIHTLPKIPYPPSLSATDCHALLDESSGPPLPVTAPLLEEEEDDDEGPFLVLFT